MLKELVVLGLLLSVSAAPSRHIKFFGDILTKSLQRFKYLGTETAFKPAIPKTANRVVLTFPKDNKKNDFIIKGIQQIDYSDRPCAMAILDGGIGKNRATIAVSSMKGDELGSEFHFFAEKSPPPSDTQQAKDQSIEPPTKAE